MINIMIDIRHILYIQIFKSVRFILHALSLDYISSSVHFKNLPPTAPQEDAWPRGCSERLPLNIHNTVMATRAVSPMRVVQNAAMTSHKGGNFYKHQMSHFNVLRLAHILALSAGLTNFEMMIRGFD